MEFMPIFSVVGSLLGGLGGGDEKKDAPAPQVQEREAAGKAEDVPQTAGDKERAAVRNARAKAPTGNSLQTRSGVAIVGGN